MLSNKIWGREGGRGECSEWWHLPAWDTITSVESCIPGCGWKPVSWREAVDEFLVLFCFAVHAAVALPSNPSSSQPMSSRTLPFQFSPSSRMGRASERLLGAELPAGLKHSNLSPWRWNFPPQQPAGSGLYWHITLCTEREQLHHKLHSRTAVRSCHFLAAGYQLWSYPDDLNIH